MIGSFSRPPLTLDPLIAEAKRRARRRRALISCAVVLLAAGSAGSAGLTLAPPSYAAQPHTFRQKLVVVARTLARSLNDPAVKSAEVYGPASYSVALSAFSNGVTTPNEKQGRFYVIALHGNFKCAVCGAGIWHVATALWTPTGGDTGWGRRAGTGLRRHKLVVSMSRLGRPKRVSLH